MSNYVIKLKRIKNILKQKGYDALVLGRRDNFAWFTEGGEGGVVLNQENSFVYLIFTKEDQIAIAIEADVVKAQEELLVDMGFRFVTLNWKGETKEEYIQELMFGKQVLSDIPLKNMEYSLDVIYDLEYPMLDSEIEKYRELGKIADDILTKTARAYRKGMTEKELKYQMLELCVKQDVDVDVLLIGSDERIKKYRHCTPTDKVIEKTILISPAFRKYGLHANIARMICIDDIPQDVRKSYDAVCQIQAEIIGYSKEGILFSDLFAKQEEVYGELGYENEWIKHGHGAPVGYMLSDGGVLYSKDRMMKMGQAYEWYVTVAGAKSAELVMNISGEQEVLSMTGKWPEKRYVTKEGQSIVLPDIMLI